MNNNAREAMYDGFIVGLLIGAVLMAVVAIIARAVHS